MAGQYLEMYGLGACRGQHGAKSFWCSQLTCSHGFRTVLPNGVSSVVRYMPLFEKDTYRRTALVVKTVGRVGMALLLTVGVAAGQSHLSVVDAAKLQDWSTVATLIGSGADVHVTQPDGAGALHWAAYWGEPETVARLIAAGATLDARNEYGVTPLWAACATRHRSTVRQLLVAGADPNLGLAAGETLLMRCAHTGDAMAVQALLDHGADVTAREPSRGQTALMWAVANRHPAVVRVLLEGGAAVDARSLAIQQLRGTGERSTTSPQGATYFDAGGFTPLLFAARHGDIASARLLLDAGADVDGVAADGNTPLVVATISGHPQLAIELLKHGAEPNASGAGYTALHAAVLRSQPAVVAALLAVGADPNARLVKSTPVPRWTYQYILTLREKGATPFALAAKYLEPEMLLTLAAAGADPLMPMVDGSNALMAAVGLGLSRATTRRSRLIAPELVSAEWSNEDLVLRTVQTVMEVGGAADINLPGRGGNTALHGAARNRFAAVADVLIRAGADPDLQNDDGTPAWELLERLTVRAGG